MENSESTYNEKIDYLELENDNAEADNKINPNKNDNIENAIFNSKLIKSEFLGTIATNTSDSSFITKETKEDRSNQSSEIQINGDSEIEGKRTFTSNTSDVEQKDNGITLRNKIPEKFSFIKKPYKENGGKNNSNKQIINNFNNNQVTSIETRNDNAINSSQDNLSFVSITSDKISNSSNEKDNRNRNSKFASNDTPSGFMVKDYSELNFVKEESSDKHDLQTSLNLSNSSIFSVSRISNSCKLFCGYFNKLISKDYSLSKEELEAIRKIDFVCSETYDAENKNHEDLLKTLVDPRRKIAYEDLGFQVSSVLKLIQLNKFYINFSLKIQDQISGLADCIH